MPDIQSIYYLHQSGQLREAEKGYLAILKQHPKHVDALHGLAILYVELQDLDKAQHYLEQAIQYQPDNAKLFLHLANILKARGLYSQAARVLEDLIENQPGFAAAYNNLGAVYYAQQKWLDAERYYRWAVEKQSNYAEAYYNLGLALIKLNRLHEAEHTYTVLLSFAPQHVAAQFQLGSILMQLNELIPAIKMFSFIEEAHPEHFETQTNLATCYLRQGDLSQAKMHYIKALQINPDDTQVLFNLGVINMQQGHIDSAIQYYQQAIKIMPDFFSAHNNLAVAFLAKQHIGFAKHHFTEALRIHPDDESLRYTLQMLSNDQRLLTAPAGYIKNLFDSYADHYEAHLLQALDYQVPSLLYQAVESVKTSAEKLDILDLGCGTGLCGIVFKPFARKMVGVDLSPKMLEVAEQKNIYNEYVVSDIVTYLKKQTDQYDLIISGDTLVYLGDLRELFALVAKALRVGGMFAFNTEIIQDEDFQMMQSGRFAHSKEYLDRLIQENKWSIISYKVAATRLQNNEPVFGHVYVVKAAQ